MPNTERLTGFFGRKAITQEGHDQLVKRTMSAISAQNQQLIARKDNALSTFRHTANELRMVNEGLTEMTVIANEAMDFLTKYQGDTAKAIADNEAVAARILEIIGE